MVFAELAKPLVSYFLIVYISRGMGKEGVGLYSTVLSLLVFFETFAILGIGNVITRDVAVEPGRASTYFSSALVVGVITTALSLVILVFLPMWLRFEPKVRSGIGIISVSMIFFISTSIIQAFFEGLQRMEYKSIGNTLETFLRVFSGILAIRYGYGIEGVLWSMVAVRIVIFLYSAITILRLIPGPLAWPEKNLVVGLIGQSMTFLLIAFMSAAYSNMDILILSQSRGSEEVGTYAAASRLMIILKGLSTGYIVALFPQMAFAYSRSAKTLCTRCSQSIKYILVLSIPATIGTTVLSPQIIRKIYGYQFVESTLCLQILIWTILAFPVGLVLARALVASHHQMYDLYANAAVMVSSLALYLTLIPMWSATGAALATVLSMLIFLCVEYAFVRRLLFKLSFFTFCAKPLTAGILMGLCTYAIRDHNLLAVILISTFTYLLLLILLKTFSSEEIETFHQVWREKYRLLTSQWSEGSQ